MDITPVIQAVIALAIAIATAFLIPWLKQHMSAQQLETLQQWVRIAVAAAEMLYKREDGAESGRGDEKKAFVLDFLKQRGLTVDEAQFDAMIEAAVYQVKRSVM